MPIYQYQARTTEGKLTTGKLESENERDALSELKQIGLFVFEIKRMNPFLYKDIYLGSPIKNKDFVIFLRQFSTLIDAGISLVEATEILSEQSNSKALTSALEEVKERIEEGEPLSVALGYYPKLFPELLVSMINAGEVSGRLDEILDRMASYYEKQYQLKQKVVTALTYPAVIGVLAVLITIFLMAFLVPVFADMFISFDQELPAYTQLVLNMSELVGSIWWLLALFVIGLIIVVRTLNKQEKFAFIFDNFKLKLPLFGVFIQKAALARMTQTLSSLLNSSVPILEAVTITEKVVENRVIKKVLRESHKSLEDGESLAEPMKEHWVFPKLITQMIAVGEATGSMDEMLKKVAQFYEEELEEAADKLKALIEPVMIIFLAIVVGAIVLAIVVPMFSLFEGV
ncbi:type IV pilus assembly protein PilC [Streptohalobacillus salinus]|uniref:Type IV pilus assembly protein PilC n=1 Tax=Streptohalobacillus salinus TaxID=621096 RepID=A0A2V3W6P3_9BACI|nr:type II secretion system F family protein [Streptohalobacillus salinus]PXW90033.1 type IV pilus assembly protein PilC [Streptohalobacillus salinus]